MSDVPDFNRQTGSTSDSPVAVDRVSNEPTRILYVGEDRRGGLLMEYFRTLARYRWMIIGFAMSGIAASFLMNFGSLPVYRARTSLDIQSLNSDFMGMHTVAPTGDVGDTSTDMYVQTQIRLLQSETLLERTVERMRSQPHPQFIDQTDLASRLERAMHLGRSKRLSYQSLIDDAAKHIVVKPLGATRLVEITCDSWSADFSAKFCNTLVDQFRDSDYETRAAESRKTSDWLIGQVEGVRQKAEESQKRLQQATGGNGLILSQESTGVGEDRLRGLQSEYVKAQADRMEKEAQAGIGTSFAPDLNESPAYHSYAVKLADLQAEVAKLVPPLTEENSQVIHLRSQIKSVQAAIAAERAANAAHLKSDYEAALHREAMLAGAYHRQEASVSSDLGKASEIGLLRREVESEQQLYQTLLQRAKEAGFASAMRASTIRVVDAAKANNVPFSPRRGDAAASGLLLGTLCGVGLAFVMERSTTVLRIPGDTERYLGLRELGVIPSSIRERKALTSVPVSNLNGAEVIPPRESQFTLSNWTENFSIVAEAYRSATTSIMLSEHPREKGRIYVISSPNPGEGKTTVTSNMGVALSKSRLRVLLIDGDLRKPALHEVLQVPNAFGFRNLLRGETGLDPDSVDPPYQTTELPNLFVLPAGQGSEEVVELLHSANTADLLKRFRCEFDVVIIDTPPMLHMADARVLASHAQGAILVVRAGMTTRDEASKARDLFDQDSVRMVGTILNDFNPNKNGLHDYYKSYNRYYMDQATAGPSGAGSWLEWLFSRDRWVMPSSATNGTPKRAARADYLDVTPETYADEEQNHETNDVSEITANSDALPLNGSNAGNGAYASNGSHASGSGLDLGEVIAPRSQQTFLMRVLGWGSTSEVETQTAIDEDEGSIYSPRTYDRRRAKRQELPELVAFYWDGGASRSHDIRDISSTGVYILTDVRWYVGTQVMISLQIPGVAESDPNRSITVNAKVVRFGTDGLAFAFVMPEKQRARRPGDLSRQPEAFSIKGADQVALYRFMQQLPKDQD